MTETRAWELSSAWTEIPRNALKTPRYLRRVWPTQKTN